MSESATHDAIEAIARDSYGRLVAYIAARSGDISDAQDASTAMRPHSPEKYPGLPSQLRIPVKKFDVTFFVV